MQLSNEIVAALLESLRKHGSHVFATPDDADFFRKRGGRLKQEPPLVKKEEPPQPIPVEPVKKSLPPPKPVEKEVPPQSKPNLHFSSVRNILSVVAPELAILNEIPTDATARKIAQRWKTKNQSAPISILILQEPPDQRALLEQIAKALEIYFAPTKIVHAEGIEKEKQWEAFLSVAELKWIIVCDYTLWQLNNLMQFYKETPAQGTRTLGNVPLFLLPDLSLYLKDPLLKRSLWKALCQKYS